jgi:hypothetical protein
MTTVRRILISGVGAILGLALGLIVALFLGMLLAGGGPGGGLLPLALLFALPLMGCVAGLLLGLKRARQ